MAGMGACVDAARSVAAVSVIGAALAAGCGSGEDADPLAGTSWQLIAVQSMADEQGTTEVTDPSKFTVSFGTGSEAGRATFQLDCNRGSGSYKVTPSGDGSGSLTFGPVATTLIQCPEPSLDQRVSSALPHVRGYLLEDNQLHMSLVADGGILTWEPT